MALFIYSTCLVTLLVFDAISSIDVYPIINMHDFYLVASAIIDPGGVFLYQKID